MDGSASSFTTANYFCDRCKTNRRLRFSTESHRHQMKVSTNGLVMYSDIHQCRAGVTGVNNLSIDNNFSVRTVFPQTFEVKEEKVRPAIPMPTMSLNKDKPDRIRIQNIADKTLNIAIVNKNQNVTVLFGKASDSENPGKSLVSKQNKVELQYFESETDFSDQFRNWFKILIDALDQQTTKIGLLVDAIRYILNRIESAPDEVSEQNIHDILGLFSLRFTLLVKDRDEILSKLAEIMDEDDLSEISKLIDPILKHPEESLGYFLTHHTGDSYHHLLKFGTLTKAGILNRK